jgi:hypothetical protein
MGRRRDYDEGYENARRDMMDRGTGSRRSNDGTYVVLRSVCAIQGAFQEGIGTALGTDLGIRRLYVSRATATKSAAVQANVPGANVIINPSSTTKCRDASAPDNLLIPVASLRR